MYANHTTIEPFEKPDNNLHNCYLRKMSPWNWDVAKPCSTTQQIVTKYQVQIKEIRFILNIKKCHKRLVLPYISSVRYEILEIVNNDFLRILKSTTNDDRDGINVWKGLISNGNTLWFYRNVNAISFQAITAKNHDEGRVHLLNLFCRFLVPEQGRRLSQLRVVFQETSSFATT